MAKKTPEKKMSKQEILAGLLKERESLSEQMEAVQDKYDDARRSENTAEVENTREQYRVKKQELNALNQKISMIEMETGIQEKISDLTKYLPLVKGLIEENKGLVVELMAYLIETGVSISEGLDEPLKKMYQLTAKHSKNYFDTLKAAGFDDAQALAILLASTKSPVSLLTEIYQSVPKNLQKR